MGVSIEEALSRECSRRLFTYQTDAPGYSPPPELGWSQADWDSLSPGCQREIERSLRQSLEPKQPETKSLRQRRHEVEYAGRKRL
jgi:hypothetical protein